MASAKDQRFNMALSAEDKAMLASIAAADDVSEAQVLRLLIREAHAARFGQASTSRVILRDIARRELERIRAAKKTKKTKR